MRLRWRVPLPGPFSVSGSVGGRRRAPRAPGCWWWALAFLFTSAALGTAGEHPAAGAVFGALAALTVAAFFYLRR